MSRLLGQHRLGFFIREVDLVDGVSSVLDGDVVVIDVGREEDF